MKKFILIAIAALLLVSSSACAILTKEAVTEPEINPDFFVAEPLAVPGASHAESDTPEDDDDDVAGGILEDDSETLPTLAEDDPLYESVMHMYQGLIPIFRYFAFEGQEYDLTALEPNDFWLFMAMIASNVDPEGVDQTGDISLPWEKVSEYAESFFPEYFASKGIPDWKNSYSAYADPRSQSVSLHSMHIDDYEGTMTGFWESAELPGCFETICEISWTVLGSAEGENKMSSNRSWKLVLEPIENDGETEREFAYKLVSFEEYDPSADGDLTVSE